MIAITCVLGRMGGASVPADLTLLTGETIPQLFARSSANDIALTLDAAPLARDLNPGRLVVDSLDLHEGLRTLTKNPTTPGPVSRIGVVFARKYRPNDAVLGVMFDRGFATDDDQQTGFHGVAREGCAVFVDAIAAYRQDDSTAIANEIRYTTLHELGHVFNLEHLAGRNCMATSSDDGPYDGGHYQFAEKHAGFLRSCSRHKCLQPGGTDYGDRAEINQSFPPNANNAPPYRVGQSALRLEISLTQSSFWYCEPVELEIAVRLPGRHGRRRIPDAVDPGYANFTIWIEEPTGERRIYRSPKFFCSAPRQRSIAPGEPFERDVSIFGEAGGYTFRREGVHRVWATLRVSENLVLASNVVECELRPPAPRFRRFARLQPLLTKAGRLLYYRSALDLGRARELVTRVAEIAPRTATAAASRYALGRAVAQLAERRDDPRLAREASNILSRASESAHLGAHSARRAIECLRHVAELARR